MYWLRTTFKEWAKKEGIELLKEDFIFIERILNKLPSGLHKSIMRQYKEKWHEGMGDSEKFSQNQNMGRFEANTWLRKQLD